LTRRRGGAERRREEEKKRRREEEKKRGKNLTQRCKGAKKQGKKRSTLLPFFPPSLLLSASLRLCVKFFELLR
jgi:hypothetical protein